MKKSNNSLIKDKENIKKSSKNSQKQPSKFNKNKKHKNSTIQKIISSHKEPLSPEFPESIANVIINKIISNAINYINVKEVYSHMDDKCFNYITFLLKPYLSVEYIYFEDGIEDINYQKQKHFYKVPSPERVNTWVEVQEPGTPEIDRYSFSQSKIVSCKTVNFDNSEKSNSKLRPRRSTHVDANLIVKEDAEYKKKQIREFNIIKERKKNPKNIEENKIEKSKKEEEQKILELPCVDLPKEKYENKYLLINNNEENSKLRKERENINIKKEGLKAIKEIEDKKEKLKKFQSILQRNIDGSKLTFDPNGKIINIHHPNPGNLISEFSFIKIPNIETKNLPYTRKRDSTSFNKNKILLKQKSFFDKKKILNYSKRESLKKTKPDTSKKPISNDVKEIFKYLRNVLLPRWQHKSMKKDSSDDEEGIYRSQRRYRANKSFREFFWPFLQYYIFKEEVERNPIDKVNNNLGYNKYDYMKNKKIFPSGSNFENIKPEVGVVILNKSNERKKEIKDGGFEFVKKYNKPSMYEFSKLVMETSQINSKFVTSGTIESKINEINEINRMNKNNEQNKEDFNYYNYNGYKMEFNDNNNPLFQGAFSINDKGRALSSFINSKNKNEIGKDNKINIIRGRNLLKSMDGKYSKKIYNSNNSMNSLNMQNSIQLTNNVKAPNLYSIFHEPNLMESVNNENDKDFYNLGQNKIRDKNTSLPIIRFRKKETNVSVIRNRLEGRKIINKFNYKILKNKKWGEDDKKRRREANNEFENISSNNIHVDNKKIQIKSSMKDINNIKLSRINKKFELFRSSSAGNF